MTSLKSIFDPRNNSIGFLRWLMALMVIFSHAGPIAGFYGGKDLGTQWSEEQSFGGVAVCGFFFLSGFLITRSKLGPVSTPRFFWHRVLRIFPGWFFALLVTAFALAPIAWFAERGTWDGFWNSTYESPLTYFSSNFTLVLGQANIAGMGLNVPLYDTHALQDWNGSAWTLMYEFIAYILVGVLGVVGALANRIVGGIVATAVIALATAQWMGIGNLPGLWDGFADIRVLLLAAPFAFGMIFALFADKIPIDDRLGVICAVIAAWTYVTHGWLVFGQYAFAYALIWFAVRFTFLKNWDRRGDFSYGLYIIGWPLMLFVTYFGVEEWGWFAYHAIVIVGCHLYAYLSWHLVEYPAMSLKRWTPRWMRAAGEALRPRRERMQRTFRPKLVLSDPRTPAAGGSS